MCSNKLKPCPICGHPVKLILCDRDGTPRDHAYLRDPWNCAYYYLTHPDNPRCPLSTEHDEPIGSFRYHDRQELIDSWNRRLSYGRHGRQHIADSEKT